MRLRIALIACLLAVPAIAQQAPRPAQVPAPQQRPAPASATASGQPIPLAVMPCIAIRPNGQESLPGYNFAAVTNGRLALLLTRSRETGSTATDFTPLETTSNASFFMENYEFRIGQQPVSIFWMGTVRENGTILIETWRRENPRPPEFSWYTLRCTP